MAYSDGYAQPRRRFGPGPGWLIAAALLSVVAATAGGKAMRGEELQGQGAGSGTTVPPSIAAPAQATPLIDRPAEAKPAAAQDDRQRRMLLLLLMNSAGPIRPFGSLGR